MTGWPHCAAPITVHSSISSSRLVKKGTMKTLIVLAALFGFSAAYVDFSKVPEQVLLQTMEGFQYPHYSGA
uniref:Uncharacterized protein n=1 Tax=Plectus sambesii TaxID=2011161 RepID=A0A914VB18_9BILA